MRPKLDEWRAIKRHIRDRLSPEGHEIVDKLNLAIGLRRLYNELYKPEYGENPELDERLKRCRNKVIDEVVDYLLS